MRKFSNFVSDFELEDLPLIGVCLPVWISSGAFYAVLYRLSGRRISTMLPSFYCRCVSDHALILMGEWWYEAKLSPFRFEHMRLSDEGFKDRVGECWRSYTFLGSPNFVLVEKLKCV